MKKNIHTRLASLVFMSIIQFTYCIAQDKLSGVSSVSPTGAAVYSVAFEAPKGVGDLKPSVGISYNSQTGNGLVGWGCNITGFSSITRGMKDWAHDNTIKGISYDTGCALYLDGKRLLLKSGTEGTDGCIYSPEGEPQTSVTLHSSLTSSTCWFEVDTSDGMVYEYGHIDGRQTISNPTAVTAWYVDKATNPLGQYISYTYQNVNLFLYPASITYGGNNSILFEYENRTDTIPFVLRDNGGYVAKRLKSVITKAGNEIYRTYTMAYTYDGNTETHFSRLQSVTEKGEDGYSTHVLSTSWNNLPSYSVSFQDTNIEFPSNSSTISYDGKYYVTGDLNNDGVSDFVRVASGAKLLQGSRVPYFFAQVIPSTVQDGEIGHEQLITIDYQTSDFTSPWPYQYGSIVITDMDGDGKNDLIIPKTNNPGAGQNFYFMRISGSDIISGNGYPGTIGLNLMAGTEIPLYAFADLNNNGKTDVVILEKQTYNGKYYLHWKEFIDYNNLVFHNIGLTLTSAPKHLYTSDFNHDGLVDIMVVCSDGCRIFYNQGGSSLQNVFVDSSTLNTGLTNHDRMEMGDFNGDGIADFIWNDDNSGNLYFEIGSANGTYSRHLAYSLGYGVFSKNTDEGTWSCMIVDLDHDGKSDVVLNVAKYTYQGFPPRLIYNSSHSYWLLSRGTTLTKKKESSSTRPDDAKPGHWFAGDFRGQGFFEVANYGHDCYNGSNASGNPTVNVYSCSSQNISNGKVASFTDSHGRSTAFTYASMTSDQVYTKGTSSEYPLLDVVAPICVTSRVSETGGSTISTQTNYTYAGLRAHLMGRGLLGFKEMKATESYTGKVTRTVVDTLNVNYYVPKNTTITTTQGGMTSSVSQNMTIKAYNYGNHTNYALFPTLQTEMDIYNNISSTTRSFDQDKGILLIENKKDDGGSFYRKTTYSYGQTKVAGAWRPTAITQEQKHPDDNNAFIKQTTLAYNNYGQKTSVVEFSNTSKPLTTTYQYDTYGNVISETLSGSGIANNAVTYYQYSSDGKFLTQKSNMAGTTGYTCNAFGEVMAEADLTNPSNSLTTTYTRNGFGLLTKAVRPTDETTTWTRTLSQEYGAAYCVTEKTLGTPEAKTWYDALGNEIRTETKGIGDVEISTTSTYNTRGELTAKTNVHGNLTTTEYYSYDGLGRLEDATASNGYSEHYDYDDREVSITRNGQEYYKIFDAWGNVITSADPISAIYYTYKSIGKPTYIDTENNSVEIQYDSNGNQISLNDPDAGTTTYEYDSMNRVTQQTDARGNVTTFSYDGAGRITSKAVNGTTTTYTYGTSGNGAGQLVSEQTGSCYIAYSYDEKGRLSQKTHTMNGEPTLTFGYHYDNWGRLTLRDYPQGVSVTYAYNEDYLVATAIGKRNISFLNSDNGLVKIRKYGGKLGSNTFLGMEDPGVLNPFPGGIALPMGGGGTAPDPGIIYNPEEPWGGNEVMPIIYYVEDSLGTYTSTYDTRGFLTSHTIKRGNTTQHAMTFNFENGTGNLLSRSGMTSQSEIFQYDDIDRLTQASGTGQCSTTYDNAGNILSKSELGSYSYDSSHPHAVISVANSQGSISSATQSVTYTAFGKIQSVSENGYSMDFTYGPDEERWKTVLRQGNSILRTTIYGDNYEQVTDSNGQTRHIYYLDGAVYVLDDGATSGRLYFAFTDHLGSITRLYSEYGNVVFAAEYDAWGKQAVTVDSLDFRRGYTGHEMMTEFNLINMNGRLYDPIVGRFLSPDNYVQLPDFSQSLNRYSYCLNNPLKYTDPDGEIAWFVVAAFAGGVFNVAFNMDNINDAGDFFKYFGVGAAAGVAGGYVGNLVTGAIATGGIIGTSGIYGGLLIGGASGATSGFILGGGNSWIINGNFNSFLSDAFVGFAIGGVTGALIGGVTGAINAHNEGRDLWTGRPKQPFPQVNIDTKLMESVAPKLPHKQDPVIQIQSNGHNYELNPNFKITHDVYIPENNGFTINRPSIEGYANRSWAEDIYHNFPRDLDNTIVNQGIYISNKGMSGFVYPGYVDGKMGFYNIILDEYNIVKHRMFYPMNKVNQIWVGSPDFKIFPR